MYNCSTSQQNFQGNWKEHMAKSVESQSFKIYPLENFDGSLARRKKYQSHSPELWHYTDAAVGLEPSYRTLCVMPTELATPSADAHGLDGPDPGEQRELRTVYEQHVHETCLGGRVRRRQQVPAERLDCAGLVDSRN